MCYKDSQSDSQLGFYLLVKPPSCNVGKEPSAEQKRACVTQRAGNNILIEKNCNAPNASLNYNFMMTKSSVNVILEFVATDFNSSPKK